MPPKPENRARRKRNTQFANERILNVIESNYASLKKRDKMFMERFGPVADLNDHNDVNGRNISSYKEGTVEKYNSIKLPVLKEQGYDEVFTALVALGMAMDRKRLDHPINGSSPGGDDIVYSNRIYIAQNVIEGDSRTENYSDILTESRLEARQALEDFAINDKTAAKKALRNVMEYMTFGISEDYFATIIGAPRKGLFKEIVKLMDDPELGLTEGLNERTVARLKAGAKKIAAADRMTELEHELYVSPGEPDSIKRKQKAEEYLLNVVIASVNSNYVKTDAEIDGDLDAVSGKYRKYLPEFDGKDFVNLLCVKCSSELGRKETPEQKAMRNTVLLGTKIKLKKLCRDNLVSPEEGILSTEGGEEQLKELCREKIRQSDIYNQLVSAKNVNEIAQAVDYVTDVYKDSSLSQLPGINIPDEEAKRLSAGIDEYKQILNDHDENIKMIAGAKIVNNLCREALVKLNSKPSVFRLGTHSNSAEFEELLAKTHALQNSVNGKSFYAWDDNVKKALLEVYSASKKYIGEKMKAAKADPNDHEWKPRSPLGQDRFEAARMIEELAATMIPDEIRREAEKEAVREEAEHLSEISGRIHPLNTCIGRMHDQAEKNIIVGSNIENDLAELIAIKMVGAVYEDREVKLDAQGRKEFADQVEATAKGIRERGDYKYLLKTVPENELQSIATEDNGKRLLPRLAQAKKDVEAFVQNNEGHNPVQFGKERKIIKN